MSQLMSFFLKKEGLILLCFTLIGYGVALSYELGYAIYFSLDTEFIQIDIKAIYNGIINVSAFFLVSLVFFTVFKQKKTSDAQKAIQVVVYLVLIGVLSSPLIPKIIFTNIITTFLICIGTGVFAFIYYDLANKDEMSLPIIYGAACLFIISMSTVVGISRASMETSFSVFKYNDREYAIIRVYNGNIIGIGVDKEKLSHTEHIFIPSSEVKTMTTRYLNIESKPGLLNYKYEYPEFPKNSIGEKILKEKK